MPSRIGRPPHPDVLTPAEWRVLEHVREGRPNAEIAVRLGISVNTVRYHVSNMLAKLDQPDRHALAAWDGEPRERFGWLPSLPPISLGLGSFGRWVAVSGAAVAAVVVLAVVLAPEKPAERQTSMALRMTEGGISSLVAMDLATGEPLAGVDRVDFTDSTGGFLGDGSLIWRTPWPEELETEITILDGARFGFGGSGFPADGEGVVQRWALPEPDGASSVTTRWFAAAPGSRWVYAVRQPFPLTEAELWRLDLRSADIALLGEFEDVPQILPTTDDRLFALTASILMELDPADGSELRRMTFDRQLAAVLSEDESLLYGFPSTEQYVVVVDLAKFEVIRIGSDGTGDPRPDTPPRWTRTLSPDEHHLYISGGGTLDCPDWDTRCEALGGLVQALDLRTMEVIHEEPGVNQVVASGDGRWIITALLVTSNDDSNLPERVQGLMGDGLRVIDTSTFEVVAHLEPGRAVLQLAASADGRFAYGLTRGSGWADLGYGDRCISECFELVVIDLEQQAITARHTYTNGRQLIPLPD